MFTRDNLSPYEQAQETRQILYTEALESVASEHGLTVAQLCECLKSGRNGGMVDTTV